MTNTRRLARLSSILIGALGLVAVSSCTVTHTPLAEMDAGSVDTAIDTNRVVIPDSGPAHDAFVQCDAGTINCGGTCTRVVSDPLNCGSCGNACPSGVTCAIGACTCMEPMIACGGVCLDVSADNMHCGSCGNVCGPGYVCRMGTCKCETATDVMCGGACADVQTDPMNCGHCGTVCTGGSTCTAGACTCPTGQGFCGGACIDILSDSTNCGTCHTTCGAGTMCMMGSCMCPGGGTACGGACVNLMTDPLNCGACISSCGGASGTCVGGRCTTCGGGQTVCGAGAHCYDTQTSTLHCGMCGHACPGGAVCTAGVCSCPGSTSVCGMSCVNLQTDPSNCGTCTHACQPMSVCTAGACQCSVGLSDCGGTCVNEQTDATHCGACATNCGPGGTCTAGACTCATGFTMCDGLSCTNTMTDRLHCGSCPHACATGEFCIAGACSNMPPTHYRETTPSTTMAPWVDACAAAGHLTLLPNADDSSALTPLPFAFRYWATDLAAGVMINVASNGFISMNGVANSSLGGSIPSATAPNATIAASWDDLETGSAGICVATLGTAPNRQWVVEWSGANDFFESNVLNFEIVLSENNGFIDIIYDTTTGLYDHVTGVENQAGTMALGGCAGGTSTTCLPTTGMRARFEPIP